MAGDTDSTPCYALELRTSLDASLGALIGLLTSVQNIETNSALLLSEMTEIKNILEHQHKSHLHELAHDGQSNYSTGYGAPFMPNVVTPSDKLLSEYNSNYDHDSNGLIYGTDFKLIGPDIPRALESINDIIPDKSVKVTMTYEQYKATVPNHELLWGK